MKTIVGISWPIVRIMSLIPKGVRQPANAFLFLRMTVFVISLPMILRIKLTRLLLLKEARIEARSAGREPSAETVARIIRYTHYLLAGVFPFPKNTCLTRAVTLYHFLSKEGLDLVVRIGAAKKDSEIIAHSWLELGGKPYLEREDPLDSLLLLHAYPLKDEKTVSTIVPRAMRHNIDEDIEPKDV